MYDYYMGLDPGLDGACAIISRDGKLLETYKFPTFIVKDTKRKLDITALLTTFKLMKVRYGDSFLATMEDLHSSPGQGVQAIYSMGFGSGVLEACLSASLIGYQLVSSQKWKNTMLSGMKKEKDASVQVALKLYPAGSSAMIGPKGGRDHNVGDAILIAEYSKRMRQSYQ